ncbi:ABC transporter ATP-binding protein [Subtercola boreus]|uniref:ABC transporter ATP-binding protein n=1 Tax=Subtercola boreus TaxID=120213 RepID=UPI001C0EECA6|nr:ABC transporter ATP-binding protein [Subtercola boreus]
MTGGADVAARGWGWRHAGRRAWAVDQLDLEIGAGERVLLLGASGAGKSTLISALAGVLGSSDEGEERGSLLVGGARPADARGRVGLLLQDPDSQVMLARVGDDVAFGCENLGVPRDEIWRRVGDALDAVGLHLPLSHPTSSLSGGQKQRLALAGVLAMQPQLLLLDEPTANLDPRGVVEVRDAVARVLEHSQATFVVIEHRVAIWQHLVNRVVVLAPGGGVLADGPPDDVLRTRGAALAAAGVWVPGHPPSRPLRAPRGAAAPAATPAAAPYAAPGGPADTAAPAATPHAPIRVSRLESDELNSASPLGSDRPHGAEPPLGVSGVGSAPLRAGGNRTGAAPLLIARDLAVARVKGTTVATGLTLDIEAGRATVITGPNGAGKSTLALTLAGLLAPAGDTPARTHPAGGQRGASDTPARTRLSGRAAAQPAGRALTASDAFAAGAGPHPIRWKSRELLTRIGTVFQDPEHQFLASTLRSELAVGPRALRLPQPQIDARVDELLDRLRLRALAEANPFTLSGGEKRRLSVATVLATRPGLLVLDEPTFGQDARTWAELVALLAELLDEGTALVAVTHDAEFVDALADAEFRMPGSLNRDGAV